MEQPKAKKATEDIQKPQENKSTKTQGDEKNQKRRKNPKNLTDEEIAAKIAEGMKRRAKKKTTPIKVSI